MVTRSAQRSAEVHGSGEHRDALRAHLLGDPLGRLGNDDLVLVSVMTVSGVASMVRISSELSWKASSTCPSRCRVIIVVVLEKLVWVALRATGGGAAGRRMNLRRPRHDRNQAGICTRVWSIWLAVVMTFESAS